VGCVGCVECVGCVGVCGVCGCVGVWGVWGCCRVGSLLTFDIPQTALVATLDTYDFKIIYFGTSIYLTTCTTGIYIFQGFILYCFAQ
jgi:hypothetical protein